MTALASLRKRLAAGWPFWLFLVLPALILPEVFAGRVFVGYADRMIDFFTAMTLAAEAFHRHSLPLWDPYIFCGTMGLGQTVLRLFYPPHLLILLLAPHHMQAACSWRIVCEFFLELSSFFLLFRKVFRDDDVALFGALGASLCTATIQYICMEMIMCFVPALILWLLWDWQARSLRVNIVALATALFVQISGPFIQHTLYWLIFCWAVSVVLCISRNGLAWRPLARLAVIWAAAFVLALSLDSMDLVPFLLSKGQSNRVLLSLNDAFQWGQAWYFASRLVFPYPFGHEGLINYPENYPIYCGVGSILFATMALRRPLTRRALAWFLAFLLISIATFRTPFYVIPWLLFSKAPLVHPRATVLAELALVFVAAEGLRLFCERDASFQTSCLIQTAAISGVVWLFGSGILGHRFAFASYLPASSWPDYIPPDAAAPLRHAANLFLTFAVANIALMAIFRLGWLTRRRFSFAICGLLIADLLFFGRHYTLHHYFSADSNWYPESAVTRFVTGLPDAGQFRFGFESKPFGGVPWADSPPAGGYHPGLAFRSWGFDYNENIPYHIHAPGGLSGFFDGRFAEIASDAPGGYHELHDDYSNDPGRADLFSIKYFVVTPPQAGDPRLSAYRTIYNDGKTAVLKKRDAIPRFHLACRAAAEPDGPRSFVAGIEARRWNLHDTAILAPNDPWLTQFEACHGPMGSLNMREATPEKLEGDADLPRPALLVVEDSWAPGWKAFVEGRQVPLHRANHEFRAVALPGGKSRVELRYEPSWLAPCKAAAGAALLLLIALGLWPVARPGAKTRRDPAKRPESAGRPGSRA